MRKHVLFDREKHVGEIQGKGAQCIGAGSLHPSGRHYNIEVDTGIIHLSVPELNKALGRFMRTKKEPPTPTRFKTDIGLNVADVIPLTGLQRRGDEYQGTHPLHGSSGGQNFSVNVVKEVWHCWRCDSGGSALEWIAVQEGLITCEQARPGCLRGELFKRVIDIAKEKHGYRPQSRLEVAPW